MSKNGSGIGVIGASDHDGWSVLVTVARDGTLLDRRRVELVGEGLPKIPHHSECQRLPLDEAVELVPRVRVPAERHAVLALEIRRRMSYVTLAMCALAALGACVCAMPVQAQWLEYKTPGIPRTADGKPDLSAPLPRSADGKPDLTGVWRTDLSAQEPPKLQPWAEAVAKGRMEDLRRDSPEALCLPGPIATLGVGKIVQTPGLLLMLYNGTLYREIFLDGRALPNHPNPDWMGYSVGRWDGEILIVESLGFNDRTWLRGDGVPGSEHLHITERIRRADFGHLEVQATYVDPDVLLAPWNVTTKFVLDDVQPLEYVCNENERDRAHIVGKASDLRSVELEPKLLAEYAGAYEYRDPAHPEIPHTWNFSVSGGQLSLSDGPSTFLLITLSQTAFATNNGVRYEFFRDAGGVVSHVMAYTFDGDVKATRRK